MSSPSASAQPLVYVLILNYNGKDYIADCLESLRASAYGNLKTMVVDNASPDGSAAIVRQGFPEVELIENPRNEYFCKGNNIGLAAILPREPDYVFILNNDTTVAPDCLERLVAFMERTPDAGACQPALVFMDRPGVLNSTGCRCTLSGKTWDRGIDEPYNAKEPSARVLGVTGGALFARASMLREVGGFCEWFKMYSEDVDLSLRIRSAGYELYCAPDALVLHKFGAASSSVRFKKIFFCERNSYWVVLRNFPLLWLLVSFAVCVPFRGAIACYMFLKGNRVYGAGIVLGLAVGLASFPVLLAQRLLRGDRTLFFSRFWRYMDARHLIPPRH
jgi:GT2 family glycosyltransferase